jgi:hypothetical protein
MTTPDDGNPFADLEAEMQETIERVDKYLDLARRLDEMDRDVTTWESDFLDRILRKLRSRLPPTGPEADVLDRMAEQYGIS